MSKNPSSNTDHGNMMWYKALSQDELPEGRVNLVSCGDTTVAVTHYDGEYAALDNHCLHQSGPLGEGSIEAGWLRCPWHGWDFDPLTGETPGPHDDCVQTYPVEVSPTRTRCEHRRYDTSMIPITTSICSQQSSSRIERQTAARAWGCAT